MTGLLKRGIIVSCQALPGEPLYGGDTMVKMALAAQLGGAVGIRANGATDIDAIKHATALPLIGLIKQSIPGSDIYITPTLTEAAAVVNAGADIVAMDMTNRENRYSQVRELLGYVHSKGRLAMADISNYAEGLEAEKMGFDYVSTTMSGYTPYSPQLLGPDIALVRRLSGSLRVPLLLEGRVWRQEDVRLALEAGAQYVVIGSAITRPQLITEMYSSMMDGWLTEHQMIAEKEGAPE